MIKRLPTVATQVCYADSASALGTIINEIARISPGYWYFPNPSKTWLVVKEEYHSEAAAALRAPTSN